MNTPQRVFSYCTDDIQRDCYGYRHNGDGTHYYLYCVDGDEVRLHWPDGGTESSYIEIDGENRVSGDSDIYVEEAVVTVNYAGTTIRIKLNETNVLVEKV